MNVKVSSVVALTALLLASASQAQHLPPGYTLVRVTDTSMNEAFPCINRVGQIVFTGRVGTDNTTMEIFLYDGRTGQTEQITNNNTQDTVPSLNDLGTISWSQVIGHNTPDGRFGEILLRTPDGTVTRLTEDELLDDGATVNNLNQVAWFKLNGRGCFEAGRDVMFFDGQTTRQITDNDWGNQSIDLSDSGDIIWTEFDFCHAMFDWRSKIKLYRDGVILTLEDLDLQSQATTLNNNGVCAWDSHDLRTGLDTGIVLWEDGVTTLLTDWGINPKLNDMGDAAFQRWHADTLTMEVWLFSRDEFFQLTDDPRWKSHTPTINNRREVAWKFGPSSTKDIAYMRRLDAGDLNCDGRVDVFDIEGFLQALFDPENFPPDCDPTLADINQDGAVNAFDIEPFIELLFP